MKSGLRSDIYRIYNAKNRTAPWSPQYTLATYTASVFFLGTFFFLHFLFDTELAHSFCFTAQNQNHGSVT